MLGRRTTRRAGAHLVEFAMVAPITFMFLFAVVEYGRFVMVRQLLDNAAREGARQAAANAPFKYDTTTQTWTAQTLTTSDIQNTVITYLSGIQLLNAAGSNLTASDIQVYRANPATGAAMTDTKGSDWKKCSFGEAIAVKLNVKYSPLVPAYNFLQSPTPVSFICIMRSEASG